MFTKSIMVLLVAAALLNVCSAGPVIDWLKNNKDTTRAAEVLSQLYPKPISDKAKFTLLVPTNSAMEAFRRDMGLTPAQFNDRTGLLDLVVAYHIIPGYQAQELKLAKSPTAAATGDINYVLRFHNTNKGVIVEDLQNNNVSLSKPVLINSASIIVIDRVLMSGSYFFTGKDALSYYQTWSEAKTFANAVGYPEGTGREQDMTFFVPDNDAMKAASGALDKLSAAQKKDLFLYHVTSPARSIPTDFKDSKVATHFKGHGVTAVVSTDETKKDEATGKPTPVVTLTSESGNKAQVNIYNIFVGRSIWQGINAVLIPKFDTKVQTEAGKNRRMLMGWALTQAINRGRSLLNRRGSSYGTSQQYANTVAADNTARAIEAAATGSIPTSYATRYRSVQAQAAGNWNDCWNCRNW